MENNYQSAWTQKMTISEQFKVTKRIFKFALRFWKQFLGAILLSGLSIIVSVTMPRVIQTFIDQHLAIKSLSMKAALLFTVIYCALLLFQVTTNYLSTYYFNMASEKTVEAIRNRLFEKINQLGMRFFDQTPGGSIVSRVTNDTETLKEFWRVFYAMFEGVITIISVFMGMLALNVKMGLIFLFFVPIMIAFIWFYQSYSSLVYRKMRENLSRLNTKINESVMGVSTIQAFRQEKRVYDEFNQQNKQHYYNRRTMVQMNSLLLMPVIHLLEGIALALIIYILGKQFFMGAVEIGVIYAFTQYATQFFRPMAMMMDSLSLLQDGVVSSSRILRYLDHQEYAPQQIEKPKAIIDQAKIEFKHLTFAYDEHNKVLDDVTFTVNPGETVAIVGHTGSGKSSIINVLMRFYEFQSGDVLIDGHSIRDFSYEELREKIGLVLQDSFLFYGDVARNIRLLDQSISDQKVKEAAEFVHADHFIGNHPDGYKRLVIERGAAYSSGQKQLISFARTMAREPKILILDEATANIDTETEHFIQDSLYRMRQGRTTIAIAHRLSTIKDAHQIIVLDKGKIIEQGSHEELIAKEGSYYQMYQLQTMN
ncbi:ABC transporter ATP-binding protein [Facklamia sp. DSM 111018]|uniref:ABC transporter ATP-binding protein n=1 Tax=Facklamia lactis TaxID=2749967 RepID=A0ABS0LP26_9LACT|nr:ABC transporter ATP-binding protein [Facklamia lactis]MBG9985889.1 ABC transporter ATP-binding protein [Facklamia lactis]